MEQTLELQKVYQALNETKIALENAVAREKLITALIDPHRQNLTAVDLSGKNKIAVAGGFSAGKSEFISSLFKDKTLKLASSVEPTTAIPAYIFNGDQTRLFGKTQKKEWVDLLSIDENLHKKLTHQFMSQFSINLKQIMPELYFQTPLVYENLCFIDTPGYNPASLEGTFTNEDKQTALDFVKDADALIWVISILSGTVPQSDLDFLREVVEHKEDMPIYMVLNKADLRPPSVQEEVFANVIEVLEDYQIDVQGISVYSSLQGQEFKYHNQSVNKFFSGFNDKDYRQQNFLKSIQTKSLVAIKAFANTRNLAPEIQSALARMIVEKQFDDHDEVGKVLAKNPTLSKDAQMILAGNFDKSDEIYKPLHQNQNSDVLDVALKEKLQRENDRKNEQKEFLKLIGSKSSKDIENFANRADLFSDVQIELANLIVKEKVGDTAYLSFYVIGCALAKNPSLTKDAQVILADYNRIEQIERDSHWHRFLSFGLDVSIDTSKYRYYSNEKNFRDALLQNPSLVPELKEKLAN